MQAGCAGHHEDCLVADHFGCFGSECRIIVICGADHNDVGFGVECRFNTLFEALEVSVVLYADAGAGEEVAGELRAGAGKCQRAAGEPMNALGSFPLRSTLKRICSNAMAPRYGRSGRTPPSTGLPEQQHLALSPGVTVSAVTSCPATSRKFGNWLVPSRVSRRVAMFLSLVAAEASIWSWINPASKAAI